MCQREVRIGLDRSPIGLHRFRVTAAAPLPVGRAQRLQRLQRRGGRLDEGHVVALNRGHRFAEPASDVGHDLTQSADDRVLALHLHLPPRQRAPRRTLRPFEPNHVASAQAGDRSGQYRPGTDALAHVHRHGPSNRLVLAKVHESQLFADSLLRHDAQVGRLFQLNGERKPQRVIEHRVARAVLEGHEKRVLFAERWRPKAAPRGEGPRRDDEDHARDGCGAPREPPGRCRSGRADRGMRRPVARDSLGWSGRPARRGFLLERPNLGDQPVATRGDRLDDLRVARVLVEDVAQLGDTTGQTGFSDELPGPDRLEDLLLRHDLARPPGEKDQQVDQLAPDVNRLVTARDAVERRFDDPVAEPEGGR